MSSPFFNRSANTFQRPTSQAATLTLTIPSVACLNLTTITHLLTSVLSVWCSNWNAGRLKGTTWWSNSSSAVKPQKLKGICTVEHFLPAPGYVRGGKYFWSTNEKTHESHFLHAYVYMLPLTLFIQMLFFSPPFLPVSTLPKSGGEA